MLLVVYGMPLQPRMYRVTLRPHADTDAQQEQEQEVLLPAAGQLLAPTSLPAKGGAASPRAVALGADNAGLPVNARCAPSWRLVEGQSRPST